MGQQIGKMKRFISAGIHSYINFFDLRPSPRTCNENGRPPKSLARVRLANEDLVFHIPLHGPKEARKTSEKLLLCGHRCYDSSKSIEKQQKGGKDEFSSEEDLTFTHRTFLVQAEVHSDAEGSNVIYWV